jgi:hypothetical protein
MKKLLLLLVITAFLFSCNSPDNSKMKMQKAYASRPVMKKSNFAPMDISMYEVPENTALKMRKWDVACPDRDRISPRSIKEIPGVMQAINDRNPGCRFDQVSARLKDQEDEDIYCRVNQFAGHRNYCTVRNNKIWLYRATCPGYSETYYLFVTVCPPPTDCTDTVKQM